MPDDQLDIEIDIPIPEELLDKPLVWKDAVEDALKDAFLGEPVTMCRRELYVALCNTLQTKRCLVSSLEAHIEAIKKIVNEYGPYSPCEQCRKVQGILDSAPAKEQT